MSFQPLLALGYSSSNVSFISHDEIAWGCGNTIAIQGISSGEQRMLRGSGFGIQTFAVCRAHGLIAVAEKSHVPAIKVYSADDLEVVGEVNLEYPLGYSALAFSADGLRLAVCGAAPNNSLVILDWMKGTTIVQAKLPQTIQHVSFHPYGSDLVATTGNGVQNVWRLEKLWDCFDFLPKPVNLGGAYEPTSHAWFEHGIYSGTSTGELFAVDLATMCPFLTAPEDLEGEAGEEAATPEVDPTPLGVKAFSAGTAILSIATNRDSVAVGGAEPSTMLFTHAHPPSKKALHVSALAASFELVYEHTLGVVGVQALEFGGEGFSHLLAGTLDGVVSMLSLDVDPSSPACPLGPKDSMTSTCFVDSHVGRVTGLCPHQSENQVVSCGEDGSVRLWDMGLRKTVRKRTFSSAQTCLAVSRSRPMAAVGSETGVIRLVLLSSYSSQPLQVTWRKRVHNTPVKGLCFSPEGDFLASADTDNQIWITALNHDGTAFVLGYIPCPEPILCITWPEVESEHSILVSLLTGSIMCLSLGDFVGGARAVATGHGMQLNQKDYTVKVVKVETPLVQMVSLVGERYGDLLGMGMDKHIHKFTLPVDDPSWLGAKGRALRSGTKQLVHRRPLGDMCLTYNCQLLVTASSDGHVATMTPGLHVVCTSLPDSRLPSAEEDEEECALHDISIGGAVAVAFDASSRNFITAGSDGSLFLYDTVGEPHITAEAYKFKRTVTAGKIDMDAFDEVSEFTEAEHHKKAHPTADPSTITAATLIAPPDDGPAPPPPSPGKDGISIARRLKTLEDHLGAAMDVNEQAPELEKVDRSAFIIFRDLVKELKSEADVRVEAVYDSVRKEHLTLELVSERVCNTCWDSLEAQGEKLTAMKSDLEVHNFPLNPYNESKLKHVSSLRRVEMVERAAVREAAAAAASADTDTVVALSPSMSVNGTTPAAKHVAGKAPAAAAAANGGGAAPLPAAVADADDQPVEESEGAKARAASGEQREAASMLEELVYPDLLLQGKMRKRMQLELLRRQVYNIKKEFNESFKIVTKMKVTEAERLMDINQRIDETVSDLRKLGVDVLQEERVEAQFPENMNNVLTVLDAEVKIDRTAADDLKKQLRAKARAEANEAGGGLAPEPSAADPATGQGAQMGERALKVMMGGTLACREKTNDEFKLDRPEWMEGNPKIFTEQQLKEFKEFQVKEKMMMEEKAKRVAALEGELRALRASLDETVAKFNDALSSLQTKKMLARGELQALRGSLDETVAKFNVALSALQTKKMLARAEVSACESRIINSTALVTSCAETGDRAEKELYTRHGTAEVSACESRIIDINALVTSCAETGDRAEKELYTRHGTAEVSACESRIIDITALVTMLLAEGERDRAEVSACESRIINITALVTSCAETGDRAKKELYTRKALYGTAEVSACESRIIDITALVTSCAETGDRAEKELYTRLSSSKETCTRVSATLSDKRAILADLEARSAEQGLEEKLLDRNFKKEFIDTEGAYSKLLQLYRLRTAVLPDEEGQAAEPKSKHKLNHQESMRQSIQLQQQIAATLLPVVEPPLASLSSRHESVLREIRSTTLDPFPALLPVMTAPPLEEPEVLDESYRPEGVEQECWQRFVAYRGQKIAAEANVKTLSASMALLHREIPRLQDEETRLTEESDATMVGLKSLRNARKMALYDGVMQLRLKAGQVEAEPPQPSSSDMSQALFIDRSVVEGVNAVVHTKGSRKIELITAIKDFKKGIYQLEWEHKRGDMMISDLREKTRELQLLHVTRDMQAVFKDGEDHSTALNERAKTMQKLAKLMDQKRTQNQDVTSHLVTLEKVLYEQERLRQSMQSVDEQVTRRMRSLVTHKRLKEIAEAQASEVAALAAELDKLRLRTYPTFVEPNHMQVAPDLNASCFSGSMRKQG
eukprot:gene9993-7873_t